MGGPLAPAPPWRAGLPADLVKVRWRGVSSPSPYCWGLLGCVVRRALNYCSLRAALGFCRGVRRGGCGRPARSGGGEVAGGACTAGGAPLSSVLTMCKWQNVWLS